jgi:uncharacterized YigZ family protein
MESDHYKTIEAPSGGLFKDKGSRFLAFAFPVATVEEVRPLIDGIRKEHHDARHHCYAYMIGIERNNWRINDDGEPSGTAGRPILGQINSNGLTNILIVVSRYFGGTLLGVSGLINAYKTAASDVISNANVIERTLHDYYRLTFPYSSMNDVKKILKEENAGQSAQQFGLECSLVADFRVLGRERVLTRISRIEGINYCFIVTK